jgi:hypothetical protein
VDLKALNLSPVREAPVRAPKADAICERFVGGLK